MRRKCWFGLFLIIGFLWMFSRNAEASAPITGTFFLGDIFLTYPEMEQMVDEWKATGIDTVVTMSSGSLKRQGTTYIEDNLFTRDNPYRDIVKIAASRNMKVFVGLVAIDSGVNITPTSQGDTNAFNDRDRAYDFSKRLIGSMKTYCANNGIAWDTIAGFYIATESPVGGDWTYQKELAAAVKSVAPEKKTLMAPYVNPSTETFNENDVYRYVYNIGKDIYGNTSIDILAPQDSLGTGKAANFLEAKTMYRALKDALVASGRSANKELWADIETFEFMNPATGGDSRPAPFARVQQQIETWKPYVTKEISWLYQQNMQLNPPVFNNAGRTWNTEYSYTPDNAVRRAMLRNGYINAYGIVVNEAVPTVALVASTNLFSDVDSTRGEMPYIKLVSEKNIMTGCGSETFCPDTLLTRAQAAVILLRAIHGGGMTPTKATAAKFTDVPIGYWAIDWINQATDEGIFGGAGGAFRPESPLTRAEAAVVFLKSAHGTSISLPAVSNFFTDSKGHWAEAWIDQLYREGGSGGCATIPLRYCPDNGMTRSQAAVMVVKLFKLDAQPTAVPTQIPINGSCTPKHYNCNSGRLGDYLEYKDQWQWWCMGSNGGTNILCAEGKPVPTTAPIATITKPQGDTNGDNKVDLFDFGIWKKEYLGQVTTKMADFDNSGKTDLADFGIWKKAYLGN